MFQPPCHEHEVLAELFHFQQGSQDLPTYIACFQQLAADMHTTESMLYMLFRNGLREEIKDELTHFPSLETLQ